jgi:hypothetical protein
MPGVPRMLSLHFLLPLIGTFGNRIARILTGLAIGSSNHQMASYFLHLVAKTHYFHVLQLLCLANGFYCSFVDIYAE